MNIYLNIEKLIKYAEINLLLDEADEIYVRNMLMQKLGLKDYEAYDVDESEIEALDEPSTLVDALFEYALSKKLVNEDDKRIFTAEIMDVVSLRPGQMEDMFDSLMESHPAKAFDWALDYAVKNGSAHADFRRWENKGDKNMEVVFAKCCGASGCCMCVSNEGFGVHRNERFLTLPINGWYYKVPHNIYSDGMARIVSAEHEPLKIGKKALDVMFDFVEMAPSMYICTSELGASNHGHFICGTKLLPIHKAPEKRKFKSKEYPYINIAETEWYINTVKLSCTNREKLTEFALKIIEAYKEGNGKLFISLRKVESKFTIELSFIGNENAKSGLVHLDTIAAAGLFVIGPKVEEEIKTIEKYLTKEIRFTPSCLTGGMEAHAAIIEKLLKEVGASQLAKVEAALDVKEECKRSIVAYLGEVKAFDDLYENFLKRFELA